MFEKKTITGVPKNEENLNPVKEGYHIFGQNIKYQYPQKVKMSDKYLHIVEKDAPILAYTSSVGEIGIINESFYRTGNNGAFQGLFSKLHKFTLRELKFILPSIKKHFDTFGYDTGMANIIDLKFKLPVKNGDIDFDFMENFIAELEAQRYAELEAQRYAELEAYLSVTGLKDTRLSLEERQALAALEDIDYKEFNLVDIFDVKNTNNILSSDIVKNSGVVPYLCASADNNAVSSYISYDEKYIEKGNCIFIGGKTFVVTYQSEDYFSNDSHNLSLTLKETSQRNRFVQLFLVSCVYKGLSHKYSWGDSVSNKKIQTDKIMLPVKDGEIDFRIMSIIISAVQKLVIKDVVAYSNTKLAAAKKIIDK